MGERYTTSISFGSSLSDSRVTPPTRGTEPAPGSVEFERFENLTRKLIAAPKRETERKKP